jgi:predicted amidohydrolase
MILSQIRVTLVQTDLFWENPVANRAMLEEKIWDLAGHTDVVLLPEMFTTGFSRQVSHAETMNLITHKWLMQMAAHLRACITGSVMITEGGHYFNRLFWVRPDGQYVVYDKKHLFGFSGEDAMFKAGEKRLTVVWKGWKICPMVCYDLRFPIWCRNTATEPYDLLLFVANWPRERIGAWDALLRARAIENVCYTAGVNRIGTDGYQKEYTGHSCLIDYKGDELLSPSTGEWVKTVQFELAPLQRFREKFPVLADADRELLVNKGQF